MLEPNNQPLEKRQRPEIEFRGEQRHQTHQTSVLIILINAGNTQGQRIAVSSIEWSERAPQFPLLHGNIQL